MLGYFDETTNTVDYRDAVEYAFVNILWSLKDDLKKAGITLTRDEICRIRDDWKENGEVLDFTHKRLTVSHLKGILEATGISNFPMLEGRDIDAFLRKQWMDSSNEYKENKAKGVFLHTISDPIMREYVFTNDSPVLNRVAFTHRGRSIRELNVGDSVVLYGRTGDDLDFSTTISSQAPDVNSIDYQNTVEYAFANIVCAAKDDLKRAGITLTRDEICRIRDNWKENGEVLDFTTKRVTFAHLKGILEATGVSDFSSFAGSDLEKTLREQWDKSRDEYMTNKNQGLYLHAISDPILRNNVLTEQAPTLKHAFVTHRGKSLRELEDGDSVVLYDRSGNDIDFLTVFRGDSGQLSQHQIIEEDIDFEHEQFMGWFGGVDSDGVDRRGLSHVFGAYLSKADRKIVEKNFDRDMLFNGRRVEASLHLLKHMRNQGYDFNIASRLQRNQISVNVNSGMGLNVRVFDDTDNGKYIGRVYDQYHNYNIHVRQNPKDGFADDLFTLDDSIAVLDYRMGRRSGSISKSVNIDTSTVYLDGLDQGKILKVTPMKDHYNALIFKDEQEAADYIKMCIDETSLNIEQEFNIDVLTGVLNTLPVIVADAEEKPLSKAAYLSEFDEHLSDNLNIRQLQRDALVLHYDRYVQGESATQAFIQLKEDQLNFVGSFDEGFNPSVVLDYLYRTHKGNDRDALKSALKIANYDASLLKGDDFALDVIKEHLIAFNPETAKDITQISHPMLQAALQSVEDTLVAGGFRGVDKAMKPSVMIDDNGIIKWTANRRTGSKKSNAMWQEISGEIGQIMVPDEYGIIHTNFKNDNNYDFVPAYTGYFTFDGDYENRMNRFRVKGFEQHLNEQLVSTVQHQMVRPFIGGLQNIPTTLDSTVLNGIYHKDVYGKRLEPDFMEVNQNSMETKIAIVKTLSQRVKFDNQYGEFATTNAETQMNSNKGVKDESSFDYWELAGGSNMRVLPEDLTNIADSTMTGSAKNQGIVWFLVDGAKVMQDGTVARSLGVLNEKGEYEPDKTALRKLDYFKFDEYNAWDRVQMCTSQLMTAPRVDEGVGVTLMTFGGWTYEDSYAVSKEFADRNKVFGKAPNAESMDVLDQYIRSHLTQQKMSLDDTGMRWSQKTIEDGLSLLSSPDEYQAFLKEHGCWRPLQRGDKLSDFGGNKGTISMVFDRHMDLEEAKELKIEKEIRWLRENPDLDCIAAPYSMLSRHNAGVIKEMMDGEVKDIIDPDTGEILGSALGRLNIIVTDMYVDKKTNAYSDEEIAEGRGRKHSGQTSWAVQSMDATGILDEVYGHSDNAWATFREYLIVTGLDMAPDGSVLQQYTPHFDEHRRLFKYDADVTSEMFLKQVKTQGGLLELPFDISFKNDSVTNQLPILSASLRKDTELIDGQMKCSDHNIAYVNIYKSIGDYLSAQTDAEREAIARTAQNEFDKIQNVIIERQFTGKHSYIRDHIMGRRMENSATAVAVADPRLDIGVVGMDYKMLDALSAQENDTIMMFRDPIWRDGAIRSMTIVQDDTVRGVAFNPVTAKSHDGDFDGDSYGCINFATDAAKDDLKSKFGHHAHLYDPCDGHNEPYFQLSMDIKSARAKALEKGDFTLEDLYHKFEDTMLSTDVETQKESLGYLNDFVHQAFEMSHGSDYVSLTDDQSVEASFQRMVDHGAKGSPSKLKELMEYYRGEKTDADKRQIQYANGVKVDVTGMAGSASQKVVAIARNHDMKGSLEAFYMTMQGTLQIKHDADQAVSVNVFLTKEIPRLLSGTDPNDLREKLSPEDLKADFLRSMREGMGVDVNEKYADSFVETLTGPDGKIMSAKDALAMKGSPMDRVAYGGGYAELNNLAKNKESLLTGKYNERFAPFAMRNAKSTTVVAKKDTVLSKRELDNMSQIVLSKEYVDKIAKNVAGLDQSMLDQRVEAILQRQQERANEKVDIKNMTDRQKKLEIVQQASDDITLAEYKKRNAIKERQAVVEKTVEDDALVI